MLSKNIMSKITKKQLMIDALSKYKNEDIENAIYCKFEATFKDWKVIKSEFSLTWNIRKPKKDYIFRQIRSWLLNRAYTESNKRLEWNTSSSNIIGIKIKIK